MNKNYKERFLRNIGIMDENGLKQIKSTSVAIGGLGLGGSIFIDLVRMGFEKFHIADPDIYERTNINRQRLAKETTIRRRKDACLIEEAQAINPDVKIKAFPEGVKPHNINKFLAGINFVVDVVDVFAMDDKILLNEEARKRHIPVASCGALGFGAAVVVFTKQSPSFSELTGMKKELPFEENMRRFLQFIAPEIPEYMQKQLFKAMNRSTHIPFVVSGVEISAAFAVAEIAKHILHLGVRPIAPIGIYIDPVDLKVERFMARHSERALSAPRKKAA